MVMMMEDELSCDLTTAQQQHSITDCLARGSEGSRGRESLILDQHTSLSLFIRLSLCPALPARTPPRTDQRQASTRRAAAAHPTADDRQEVLLLLQVLHSVIEAIGRINVGFVRLCKAWIRFGLQFNVAALVETNGAEKCPNI